MGRVSRPPRASRGPNRYRRPVASQPDPDEHPPAPFVVGVPRSGTTLLRLQLDAHPELAIPSETGFGPLTATQLAADELLDALAKLSTWQDLGVNRAELSRAFASEEVWSVGAGLRAYYRLYARKHGKRRWGDKTPGNVAHMESLAAALPEARFVHLIRDGRDVAASLRGLPFAPADRGIEAIAAYWRDAIVRARRIGARLRHYREVRYEELVGEPEATLRELCTFLDLPFDAAMLRAHERAGQRLAEMRSAQLDAEGAIVLEEGKRIESRTRRPPDPARAGRWREALTEHDIGQFERVAGGELAELGYEPSYSAPSQGRRQRSQGDHARDRSDRMRVVIGTHLLLNPGGTESQVIAVARELERLGHDVTVTAEEFGPVAERAEQDGIRLARAPDELPGACDAVIAHDATMTAVLAERYPDARLIYVAHSDRSDHQLPVLVPGVVDAVVACSDRLASRIRSLALDVPIVRLREPIDTDRFARGTPLPTRPRKALILSNYLDGERERVLRDAWQPAGIEFLRVGASRFELDPLPAIREADIVVAKARAALEGMACARAVYLYDQFGGDGWVTPDNYPALEADNFAGQADAAARTGARIAADLADYHPDMGPANDELVRNHHGARYHANEMVAVLRGPHMRPADGTTALAEHARLTRLNWRAERRRVALEHETALLHERAVTADARARDGEERVAALEAERERAAATERQLAEARGLLETERERAAATERQLADARGLLETRRVQFGLRLGRALDRVRGRG
jgi:hypothetical protein